MKVAIDSGSHISGSGIKTLCTTFFSFHSKNPLLLQNRWNVGYLLPTVHKLNVGNVILTCLSDNEVRFQE